MIYIEKCDSIDEFNEVSDQSIVLLKENGFFVKKQLDFTAFPFEESDHFSVSEIEEILLLTENLSKKVFGGIFNSEFSLLEKFTGILDKEALTFLNENYRSSKIYFCNENLDFLFFLSGIEYGVLFTKKRLGENFFKKSLDQIINDFYRLTLGWPDNWNMSFLNTILKNTKIYNNESEENFVNFLPVKVIKLT